MTAQLVRFVVVGVIGAIVDIGGTLLLIRLGVPSIVARVPALAAAIVTTWLLHRRHTFRVERPKTTRELLRFSSIAVSSAVMNFLLYSALVLAGVHPLLAIVIATLALMTFSFVSYKKVAFR